MSSKILSVSEKTRRQFLQQKIVTAIRTALVRHLLFQSFPRGKILESLLECMNQNQFFVVYIISLFQYVLKQLFTSVSVVSGGYLPRRFAAW